MKRREFFGVLIAAGFAKDDPWLKEGVVGYRAVATPAQKAFGKSCANCRYYAVGFCRLPAALSAMKVKMVRVKAEGCCDGWLKDS